MLTKSVKSCKLVGLPDVPRVPAVKLESLDFLVLSQTNLISDNKDTFAIRESDDKTQFCSGA